MTVTLNDFNFCYYFTGLSKEGWYIIKNLFTEMTVLLAGFFTFVPAVQVSVFFCLFVCLCDFLFCFVLFFSISFLCLCLIL